MGQHQAQRNRVVIIGAGFGGFQAAQSLASSNAEVVLVDQNNYSTFIPLIYQIATAQIEPSLVAYPIRTKLRGIENVRLLQAVVDRIDFDNKLVGTPAGLLPYDYLVIATGTKPSYHGVSGAEEHAFTLKSLGDAIALRDHILTCLEKAAVTKDMQERQQLLTVVIVGGGATGVEMAGALSELFRGAFRRDFAELVGQERIILVQSGSSLLTEFSQRLGNYTHRKLEKLGVEVCLNTQMAKVTSTSATLSNNRFIETATVIWAAGIQAQSPDLAQPVESAAKGKLLVRNTLQLVDQANVYAIGDVAHFEKNGNILSGVAPEALQQGVAVARNICLQMQGNPPRPFEYWNKGRLAIIGGYGGVGRIAGVNFSGFLAWILWLAVHVAYLPGFRSRLVVVLTWFQNYVLGDRAVRQVSSSKCSASDPQPRRDP